jgi:O-antigen/teichoic acid export membrane protein
MFRRIASLLLHNKSERQTVIKNTFWLTVVSVGGKAIRAVLVIYAARVLGAESYGAFSYALGFVAIFIGFSDIGINMIMNRDLAKYPERQEPILATGLAIKGILMVLTYAAVFIAMPFASIAQARVLIPFLAASLLFDGMRDFGFSMTRANQKMEVEAFISIIYQLVSVGAGFALLSISRTPLALAAAYVIGSFVGAVAILRYIQPLLANLRKNFDRTLFVPIIRDAAPFAIVIFGNTFLLYTDTILLGALKTGTDVGLYNAATKILQVVMIVPSLFLVSAFPVLTRKVAEGRAESLIGRLFALTLLFAFPIAAGGVLFSDFLMTAVFGAGYAAAGPIFSVVILMVLISFPAGVIGYTILAKNKQSTIVKYNLFAAIFNIFLTYMLIKQYGNIGAALGTLLSQSIMFFGPLYELKKTERVHILTDSRRAFLATFVMCIGIIALRKIGVHNITNILIAPIVYGSTLLILKEALVYDLLSPFASFLPRPSSKE